MSRPPGGARDPDLRRAPYHLADMSTTALAMLRWHRELEPDRRLMRYVDDYAARLCALQRRDGFFPAWLAADTEQPLGVLDSSAESALSATFLFELARARGGDKGVEHVALAALEAVAREVVPARRWEDFETYWSCCPFGDDALVGRRVARNALPKQSNLALSWTAEAMLAAHTTTGDAAWLEAGARVLDELCMTQAVWQPPAFGVEVVGGFGVMNADAEWNDARSSLFAELLVQYAHALADPDYLARGIAALRAAFVMQAAPENPRTLAQWRRVAPWLGSWDYGFAMENYGHDGVARDDGTGMGGFCIYDWGPGSAAASYERLRAAHGAALLAPPVAR